MLLSLHEGLLIQNLLGKAWTSYDFWDAEEAIDSSVEKELKKALDERDSFLVFAIFSRFVYFVEPIINGERHTIWISLRFVTHLRH